MASVWAPMLAARGVDTRMDPTGTAAVARTPKPVWQHRLQASKRDGVWC